MQLMAALEALVDSDTDRLMLAWLHPGQRYFGAGQAKSGLPRSWAKARYFPPTDPIPRKRRRRKANT